MSNTICTKEPLKIGGRYQYKEGLTGFGDAQFLEVELIEDNSDKDYYRYKFKPLSELPNGWNLNRKGLFEVELAKGDYYYSGMPRIYDEGEYV